MEKEEFEKKIKEYLKSKLSITAQEKGGVYGSRKYIEIQLKLDDEIISETWIDN